MRTDSQIYWSHMKTTTKKVDFTGHCMKTIDLFTLKPGSTCNYCRLILTHLSQSLNMFCLFHEELLCFSKKCDISELTSQRYHSKMRCWNIVWNKNYVNMQDEASRNIDLETWQIYISPTHIFSYFGDKRSMSNQWFYFWIHPISKTKCETYYNVWLLYQHAFVREKYSELTLFFH